MKKRTVVLASPLPPLFTYLTTVCSVDLIRGSET